MLRIPTLATTALLTILTAASCLHAQITTGELTDLFGSGSNTLGVAIDFNDGSEAVTLGYQYDGTLTAETVLADLAGNPDTRLRVRWSAPGMFGRSLWGVGTDGDGDGFSITDPDGAVSFVNGVAETPGSGNATATDLDDRYAEGDFNPAFWSLWIGEDGGDWGFAPLGISGLTFDTDGQWFGLSFTEDFNDGSTPPSLVIPEPASAMILLALGGAIVARRRRG